MTIDPEKKSKEGPICPTCPHFEMYLLRIVNSVIYLKQL